MGVARCAVVGGHVARCAVVSGRVARWIVGLHAVGSAPVARCVHDVIFQSCTLRDAVVVRKLGLSGVAQPLRDVRCAVVSDHSRCVAAPPACPQTSRSAFRLLLRHLHSGFVSRIWICSGHCRVFCRGFLHSFLVTRQTATGPRIPPVRWPGPPASGAQVPKPKPNRLGCEGVGGWGVSPRC